MTAIWQFWAERLGLPLLLADRTGAIAQPFRASARCASASAPAPHAVRLRQAPSRAFSRADASAASACAPHPCRARDHRTRLTPLSAARREPRPTRPANRIAPASRFERNTFRHRRPFSVSSMIDLQARWAAKAAKPDKGEQRGVGQRQGERHQDHRAGIEACHRRTRHGRPNSRAVERTPTIASSSLSWQA